MSFVINNWHLFLALFVVLYLLISEPLMLKMSGAQVINVSQAIRLMNQKTSVVVDVTEPQEFQAGHLPKARNIPLKQLAERTSELEKKKKMPVIVVCRSGNRSKKGAMILGREGFEQVYTISGGLQAWQKENLPVEKEEQAAG